MYLLGIRFFSEALHIFDYLLHYLIPYLQCCPLVLTVKILGLSYLGLFDFISCLGVYMVNTAWIASRILHFPLPGLHWILPSCPTFEKTSCQGLLTIIEERIESRNSVQSCHSSVHFRMAICMVQFLHSTKPFSSDVQK